jgi:hypothetical protein
MKTSSGHSILAHQNTLKAEFNQPQASIKHPFSITSIHGHNERQTKPFYNSTQSVPISIESNPNFRTYSKILTQNNTTKITNFTYKYLAHKTKPINPINNQSINITHRKPKNLKRNNTQSVSPWKPNQNSNIIPLAPKWKQVSIDPLINRLLQVP